MRFPELVPNFLCKTDIEVTIYQEGITEDGAPLENNLGTLKCNYQDGAKAILTDEKKKVEITGKPYSTETYVRIWLQSVPGMLFYSALNEIL